MTDIKSKSDMKRRNALAGRPMDHGIAERDAMGKCADECAGMVNPIEACRIGWQARAAYQGEAKAESLPEAPSENTSSENIALNAIASLGIYCCDDESLGHECEPVRIARETLGLDVYSNRWTKADAATTKKESLPSSFATDMCDEMENQACNHAFEKYQRVYQGVTHRQKDIFEFAWNQALDWRDQRGDWPKVFPLTTDGENKNSAMEKALRGALIKEEEGARIIGVKTLRLKDERIAELERQLEFKLEREIETPDWSKGYSAGWKDQAAKIAELEAENKELGITLEGALESNFRLSAELAKLRA